MMLGRRTVQPPRENAMDQQELKKVGLKATLPRLKILNILEHNEQRHLSAEDVYKALLDAGEEVGLATVYRVLTQFEAAGLVKRHNFEGGHAVFELDHGEHHDHMVCVKCGRIEEFLDPTIEDRQRKIARDAGFEMTDHAMYLYGICAQCRGRGQ
jgi:Fur family ferric uptake transcriptional regulator